MYFISIFFYSTLFNYRYLFYIYHKKNYKNHKYQRHLSYNYSLCSYKFLIIMIFYHVLLNFHHPMFFHLTLKKC